MQEHTLIAGDGSLGCVAGLAHRWFVALHPTDDGNGRIGLLHAGITAAQSC